MRRSSTRLWLLAAVATAIFAAVPAAAAPADEPIALRGPPSGSVWPATSTILLEADTPWFCTSCAGTMHVLVALDAGMSHLIWAATGPCPPADHPTCPTWAAAGPFVPGTYYWRVVANFDDGTTHQSDIWSFTVTDHGDGNSRNFADAPGDSRGAPDVTSVQVWQTGGRLIRVAASIPGLTRLAPDQNIWLALDTDQDGTTGDFGYGADYLFRLNGETGRRGFWRWEGDHWVDAATTSAWIWYGSGGVVAIFDRDSIGGDKTTGFNFYVETLKGDADAADPLWEFAPDTGVWNVQLPPAAAATPTIKALTVRTSPAAPVAGSTFRVRVPSVTLSDGHHPAPDYVTCRALLTGRPLRASGNCTFRIPAGAAGKRLAVRVTANYVDRVATRTLPFVVRGAA